MRLSPDIDSCVYLSDVVRDDRCRMVMDDFFELVTPDELGQSCYDGFDGFGYGLLLLPLDLFHQNEEKTSILERRRSSLKQHSVQLSMWPIVRILKTL